MQQAWPAYCPRAHVVRAHVCIAALPAATVLPLAEWDLRARCVSDDVAGFSHLLICTSLGALLTCAAVLPSSVNQQVHLQWLQRHAHLRLLGIQQLWFPVDPLIR